MKYFHLGLEQVPGSGEFCWQAVAKRADLEGLSALDDETTVSEFVDHKIGIWVIRPRGANRSRDSSLTRCDKTDMSFGHVYIFGVAPELNQEPYYFTKTLANRF